MRKTLYFAILSLGLMTSCGGRKSVSEVSDVKVFETMGLNRMAPGETVYLAAPRQEPARPEPEVSRIAIHDTVIRQEGENGAKLAVRLRGREFVEAECSCPPVMERTVETRALDEGSKKKETDRQEAVGWKAVVAAFIIGFLVGIIVWITKPWRGLFSWSRIAKALK